MPLETSSTQFLAGEGGRDDSDACCTVVAVRATDVQSDYLVAISLEM